MNERLPSSSCRVFRRKVGNRWQIWKTYPSHRGFRQELEALTALHPERILDADPSTRTLVLVEQPGLPAPDRPAVHRAAGCWLRALHRRPFVDDDPLPLARALEWRSRAAGLPACFDDVDAPRVWCHRDFHPRNWLWDGSTLVVIDFEHARPDHPTWDLVKLAVEVWPRHPALREAFREGYGDWDEELLERFCALFHAQTAQRLKGRR